MVRGRSELIIFLDLVAEDWRGTTLLFRDFEPTFLNQNQFFAQNEREHFIHFKRSSPFPDKN